ncbi:unnamed protein product, partial [Urochloa humidicola]
FASLPLCPLFVLSSFFLCSGTVEVELLDTDLVAVELQRIPYGLVTGARVPRCPGAAITGAVPRRLTGGMLFAWLGAVRRRFTTTSRREWQGWSGQVEALSDDFLRASDANLMVDVESYCLTACLQVLLSQGGKNTLWKIE